MCLFCLSSVNKDSTVLILFLNPWESQGLSIKMLFFLLFGNFVLKFHFPFACRPNQVFISCSVHRLH